MGAKAFFRFNTLPSTPNVKSWAATASLVPPLFLRCASAEVFPGCPALPETDKPHQPKPRPGTTLWTLVFLLYVVPGAG